MTGRYISAADRDHAVKIYLAGKTIEQAAAEVGINPKTLTTELRRRGVKTSRRGTWRELPHNAIAAEYTQGLSELALATKHGVQRGAIRASLKQSGIAPRGRSDAGLMRAAQMTVEERATQAAAAHEATLGRKATWEERCKRAQTWEQNPGTLSVYERQFATWLDNQAVSYRREVAIGIYNVDFVVGPVAVEILGGEWHAYKTRHTSRTPYILDQGWSLAFLWATVNCPLTEYALDQTMAFSHAVSRDPSLIGEYRVIRGDGHLVACGRCDGNQFSGITPARNRPDVTRSELSSMAANARYGRTPYDTPGMYRH